MQATPRLRSSSSEVVCAGFHGSPAVNGCKIWGTSGGRQRTHVEMPVAAFPGDDTERPGSSVWGKTNADTARGLDLLLAAPDC
ncbi:predicted protein [Chaetomium globosum CBS 148.51]|uniref:Uncharacterized protein n=1 Tax=Chaetomium globosum (strain ATCC 6205 / CBS 148.51 / DSM 1962 / NBRC 6347 / NRRL 1970) TaxID=306901 RepID=Q2GV90_CHAGB|nr:uncharacterized protein CHGG_08114 [Chaetomium globosum CBS 148.51]EAQ86861.1 predicted protein [Chaetomium globosum CBS 148.51]